PIDTWSYSFPLITLPHLHPSCPSLLSLHDALPISDAITSIGPVDVGLSLLAVLRDGKAGEPPAGWAELGRPADDWNCEHRFGMRSEEHTSELQSLAYLVCRLLLEKKKMEADPSLMS